MRAPCIEVIAGCMFSGKTIALLNQIRRAQLARLAVQLFKPAADTRFSVDHVVSHDNTQIAAAPVESAAHLFAMVRGDTDVVGIDEAQFFDAGIVECVLGLANYGRRVIVAGLDTDWRGEPYGSMPALMAIADTVLKQTAVCFLCGDAAVRTQRVFDGGPQLLLGAHGVYEARCRRHFGYPAIEEDPIHFRLWGADA